MSKANDIVTELTSKIEALTAAAEEFKACSKQFEERTASLEEQAKLLEAQLKIARGTVKRAKRGTGDQIAERVLELITERPMTLGELFEAMPAEGVPANIAKQRICNALVKLQRERRGVVNLGNQSRAMWFHPNEELLGRLRGN